MSHKAFDLEAAKRGELIQYKMFNATGYGKWVAAYFHGESLFTPGKFTIEYEHSPRLWATAYADAHELHIVPKKKVWYCQHWIDAGGVPQLYKSRTPVVYDPGDDSHGEPFTIEVEE